MFANLSKMSRTKHGHIAVSSQPGTGWIQARATFRLLLVAGQVDKKNRLANCISEAPGNFQEFDVVPKSGRSGRIRTPDHWLGGTVMSPRQARSLGRLDYTEMVIMYNFGALQ